MSPEQLKSMVNAVEMKLQTDLILFKGIEEHSASNTNQLNVKWKYRGMRILQVFGWFHQILVCYCILSRSSQASLYCLDLLYGMGSFGSAMSGCYMCGYTLLLLHLIVIGRQERKNELHILTHMKNAHEMDLTPEERKKYARNLFWILIKNIIIFLFVGIPMTGFYLIGVVLSAYKFQSWYFSIMSVFMLAMYGITGYNCIIIFANVHLMTAHSTNYFRIRICNIRSLLRGWLKDVRRGSLRHKLEDYSLLNDVIWKTESVLQEIREHNKTIKFFLRDTQMVLGPMIGMLIVFFASDCPWYLRGITAGGTSCIVAAAVYSLYNASGLHLNLIKLCSDLHSCQATLVAESPKDIKMKFHLLRLIYRTSSERLPVGFTVGDTGSFTPGSAGFFISHTISVSTLFLNTT